MQETSFPHPSPTQPLQHMGWSNFLLVSHMQLFQRWPKREAGIGIHFESQLYLGLNHWDAVIYTFPPLRAAHKAQRGPIIHFRILLWNALSSECYMAQSEPCCEEPGALCKEHSALLRQEKWTPGGNGLQFLPLQEGSAATINHVRLEAMVIHLGQQHPKADAAKELPVWVKFFPSSKPPLLGRGRG